MDKKTITQEIITILERHGEISTPTEHEKNKYRYLDEGHIDSISIINFIIEIEEKFQILLLPEDTQSDEFRYIEGLSTLIENKIRAKSYA